MGGYFGAGLGVAVGGWLTGCVATGTAVGRDVVVETALGVAVALCGCGVSVALVPMTPGEVDDPPLLACWLVVSVVLALLFSAPKAQQDISKMPVMLPTMICVRRVCPLYQGHA